MIEGKTVFITGGAGFIGSTLAGRLVETNRIVIYDNLSRNALQHAAFRGHSNLRLIEGDVLDAPALEAAIQGADIVVTGLLITVSIPAIAAQCTTISAP
jgi:UDP-glucose 4-epimerase